jgi:membrane protease YdiL (CAAX protease family)
MRKMPTTAGQKSLAQLAEGYWVESRRPLASLVFIAPLLIAYELGVVWLGVQNGADAFMRRLLNVLGFSQHLLLPILMICILLGWHYLSHQPWRLSRGTISGMAAESVLLAICLRAVLSLQKSVFTAMTPLVELSIGDKFKNAVGFLGAGIYEELLFRLILLSLVAWGLLRVGRKPWIGMIVAALLTSMLFAAAHYVGASGDNFQWFSFIFRFLAGLFFAIVFVYRGFGIAAGSHAAYDLLVGTF